MKTIMARKSFRTYDGRDLREEHIDALRSFCEKADNPYGIPVEFRFLDPDRYGLKSPVLSGVTLYLGAKVRRVPHFEEALGYTMEAVVIYAMSLGIGTVWIGGTMNRDAFEKAMELGPDEVMPCVTPLGYPADKMGLKETLMRKGVKADWRKPADEIIFDGEYGKSFAVMPDGALGDALEMVRWAPSAVNKQPWRIVVSGNDIHFYEKPDKGYVSSSTGDLQMIDMGIGLYHFVYGMEKAGRKVSLKVEDPGISVPDGVKYTATITAEEK